MSQKEIDKNIHNLEQKSLKRIVDDNNKYLLEKYYKLGPKYCKSENFKNFMILEMINFGNKDLIKFMISVLEKGPDECFEVEIPCLLNQEKQKSVTCKTEKEKILIQEEPEECNFSLEGVVANSDCTITLYEDDDVYGSINQDLSVSRNVGGDLSNPVEIVGNINNFFEYIGVNSEEGRLGFVFEENGRLQLGIAS